MSQLFISYSHVDDEFVERLVNHIQIAFPDLRIWRDKASTGLAGGDLWRKVIRNAIAESDIFVYVLTTESVKSRYCKGEFSRARRLKKPIIPIQARDMTEQSPHFGDIQIIDMRRGLGGSDAFPRLVAAIIKHLELVKPEQKEEEAPCPPGSGIPPQIVGVVVMVVIVVMVLLFILLRDRICTSTPTPVVQVNPALSETPPALTTTDPPTLNRGTQQATVTDTATPSPTATSMVFCESTPSPRSPIVGTSALPASSISVNFSMPEPADRCNLSPTGNGSRISVSGTVGGSLNNIRLYLLIFAGGAYSLAYDRACAAAVIVTNGSWSTEADLQGPNSSYELVLIAAGLGSRADIWLQDRLQTACDNRIYQPFVPDTGSSPPLGMGLMPLDDVWEVGFITVATRSQ